MRQPLLALAIFISTPFAAYGQQDTTQAKVLDEIVVTAQNHQVIDHGVAYTPTPADRRHSANYLDLLGQMMVPGLKVDVFSGKVESAWGGDIHYYIDGQEAELWQVKAMRPKEVARVEYLLSPPDPKYKQYQAVVNFVLRQRDDGGYVYAEGTQGIIYNNGDYQVSAKLKNNKMTWLATAGANYSRADDITHNETSTFRYDDQSLTTRTSQGTQTQHSSQYYGAMRARYDAEKLVFWLDGGLKYSDNPKYDERARVLFARSAPTDNGGTSPSANPNLTDNTAVYSLSTTASTTLAPYVKGYLQLKGLPHKSDVYASFSFSYNRNRSTSRYLLPSANLDIPNGYREDVYLPTMTLGWQMPVYRQNMLTVVGKAQLEMYRTHYSGTDNSYQRLNNHYYRFMVQYAHRFSDKWSGKLLVNLPIQSFKVNDRAWRTTAYLNARASINGRIGTKHSFFGEFSLSQSNIEPSYYNSVVRLDNELEGSKGNADLKTMQQLYALVTYTWMPSNAFSLNASVQWDGYFNEIVPWYHPINGIMVREMVNSGNFTPLYLSITPSLSAFGGRLRLSAMMMYEHEFHSGRLYHLDHGYWGFFPRATYRFDKHFMATVGYAAMSGRGYMRGTSVMSSKDDYGLNLKVQYNAGNFVCSVMANHVLNKTGWWKSWLDSNYINQYSYLSRPWDGMYFSVNASYTFNFGKRSLSRDNLRFSGQEKSSAL